MEKEETLAFWKFLTSGEWRVARKDWRSSEYLKKIRGFMPVKTVVIGMKTVAVAVRC